MSKRKAKRKSRAMDPAIKALKWGMEAMEVCPVYMRQPTLEFLWGKYVRPKF
jgi:hypothetical protein